MNNFYDFTQSITQYNQQTALVRLSDNCSFSYKQLVNESYCLANFLFGKIKTGDRVVLTGIYDFDWVKSFLVIILSRWNCCANR